MSDAVKAIVGDELYNQVVAKLGDKKIDILSDNYIPKSRVDEVNVAKNTLKTQVDELVGQMATLQKSNAGNAELQKTLEELQKKNTEWEGKYNNTILESAIKAEAFKEQARDPQDILAFINRENVKLDSTGKLLGLTEQLTDLKKNKAYLFDIKTDTTKPPASNPAGTKDPETEKWGDIFKGFVHT